MMKLGLLTSCLGWLSLGEVAEWAARTGYEALEVAAWPVGSEHIHQAAHVDVVDLSEDGAREIRTLLDCHGLSVPALTYCENNLYHNSDERRRIQGHLHSVIDAASRLGVPRVCTFIGRDATLSARENIELAEAEFPPIVKHAEQVGVQMLIENCPMEGWSPDGYPGNLAYSPELWDWMATLGLKLTYDPSHLPWLGIDPLDALKEALDKDLVVHVQAKDIEIDEQARTRYGVFGKTVSRTGGTDVGWWKYRVPGRGQIDWNRIIDTLYTSGYNGTIAVEHEDLIWGGTLAKTLTGLEIAYQTLRPFLAFPESQGRGAMADNPGR
jgi:sugar phosphate isomerase/epimerase